MPVLELLLAVVVLEAGDAAGRLAAQHKVFLLQRLHLLQVAAADDGPARGRRRAPARRCHRQHDGERRGGHQQRSLPVEEGSPPRVQRAYTTCSVLRARIIHMAPLLLRSNGSLRLLSPRAYEATLAFSLSRSKEKNASSSPSSSHVRRCPQREAARRTTARIFITGGNCGIPRARTRSNMIPVSFSLSCCLLSYRPSPLLADDNDRCETTRSVHFHRRNNNDNNTTTNNNNGRQRVSESRSTANNIQRQCRRRRHRRYRYWHNRPALSSPSSAKRTDVVVVAILVARDVADTALLVVHTQALRATTLTITTGMIHPGRPSRAHHHVRVDERVPATT